MNSAELLLHQVDKRFVHGSGQNRLVLKNVSAHFMQGSTYAFVGASGTGKSTLIHLLAGIEVPDGGIVSYNSKNIEHFSSQERALFLQRSVGLLFQKSYLITELSVVENVMVPGLIAGQDYASCFTHATEFLQFVGLGDTLRDKPASLSGGQQQRVALARALFNRPAFLLADEPTSSLDVSMTHEIVRLLLRCNRTWNMGLIISTHDTYVADMMELVYEIADGTLHRRSSLSQTSASERVSYDTGR